MIDIGKIIRMLRRKKEISLKDMANELDISIPALSKIETGITDLNLSRINQIALVLEITLSDLFSLQLEEPKTTKEEEQNILFTMLSNKDHEIDKLQKRIIGLYEELRAK